MKNKEPKYRVVPKTLTDGSIVFNVMCGNEEMAAPASQFDADRICERLNAGKSGVTKGMIRRSHEAQFNGIDYQQITWDIIQGLSYTLTHDEIVELQSSPDPGCDCGFCAKAEWQD